MTRYRNNIIVVNLEGHDILIGDWPEKEDPFTQANLLNNGIKSDGKKPPCLMPGVRQMAYSRRNQSSTFVMFDRILCIYCSIDNRLYVARRKDHE